MLPILVIGMGEPQIWPFKQGQGDIPQGAPGPERPVSALQPQSLGLRAGRGNVLMALAVAVLKERRALESGSVPRSEGTSASLGSKGAIAQKCRACICWGRLVLGEEAIEQTWRGYAAIATASADPLLLQLHCVIQMPLSLNLSMGKGTAG